MDLTGLAKHVLTLFSSVLDICSDITNSLNFLGYFHQESNMNSSTSSLNTSFPANTMLTPLRSTPLSDLCDSSRSRIDQLWGILSMGIIFLPGLVFGITKIILGTHKCNFIRSTSTILQGIIYAVAFPIILLCWLLAPILNIYRQKPISQDTQLEITTMVGVEATIESTSQLLLQLFTILNGYPGSWIQNIAIGASFLQLARCSILLDVQMKAHLSDVVELTCTQSLFETLYRLPLYLSTIVFRVVSLCLTMAFLRYWALVPIGVLIFFLTLIAWRRHTQLLKNRNRAMESTVHLVVANLGVVNAYSFDQDEIGEEQQKYVVKFIRHSAIATFMLHSLSLSIIMIMGFSNPATMAHWGSKCDFLLKPGNQEFYWVFMTVLLLGCYSLTGILYNAEIMATIKARHHHVAKEEENDVGGTKA